jgi:glycosyltransferase involved in cell wall biosynthesis
MSATIDVVITCYNSAWSLQASIASIQRQTIKDIRIIIVDDGSTDNTSEVLTEISAADPRIHVVSQENRGIPAAANAGLALCTAAYIARQDADDLSDLDRFEKQLKYFELNPDCVATSGDARHIDREGRDLGTVTSMREPGSCDPFWIPAHEPYLFHPLVMFRSEALRKIGFYRPFMVSEDADLFWRLSREGRLHKMHDLLGCYRLHPDSISSRSIVHGRQMAACSELAAISAQRYQRNVADLPLDEGFFAQLGKARSFEDLCTMVNPYLDAGEQQWFALAVAIKFLGFCCYRPFEPELTDCHFVRQAMMLEQGKMSNEQAQSINRTVLHTATRILQKGMWREAFSIVYPAQLPLLVIKAVFRISLSEGARQRLKSAIGRMSHVQELKP